MMPENNLRETLLAAEPISTERQQRFHEELARIVEPRLPRGHRLYYQICLACLALGLPGAACGFFLDEEHRWIWGLNLLVFVSMAGWILHILRRGAEPLHAMQGMSKAFAGITFAVALLVIVQALASPSLADVVWGLLALLLFLLTSSINIWNCVIVAERSVREDILRVEYRLADLAARLPAPAKPED